MSAPALAWRVGFARAPGHEFFSGDTQHVVVEPRTPQPAFPLHEPDFCELVIVASGNGWHVLNDEPHLAELPGLVWAPRAGVGGAA